MNAMTTAALLAGFATGMALSTGADEIETHAKFVKDTFFGKDSHLCAFVRTETLPQKVGFKWSPFGLAPTPRKADDWELLPNDPELPFFDAEGDRCNSSSNCWPGYCTPACVVEPAGFALVRT